MIRSKRDKVFDAVVITILVILMITMIYPFIYIISASLSDYKHIGSGEVWLLPKGFNVDAYERILAEKEIWTGYANTIFYTVVGTVVNVFVTMICAYPMSRKDLKGRGLLTIFFTIPMFIGGGIIPTYLLIKGLGLLNTRWVMIIPGAMAIWNMIIARTFVQGLPYELQEAAQIDGCSNIRIFAEIIMPLSSPVVAVLVLYYGIGHWNEYFGALIYITNRKLYPLQLILREILVQQEMSSSMMRTTSEMMSAAKQAEIAETLKYSTIIVSTLPVIIAYPFFQKYFEKGMMVGSIKG